MEKLQYHLLAKLLELKTKIKFGKIFQLTPLLQSLLNCSRRIAPTLNLAPKQAEERWYFSSESSCAISGFYYQLRLSYDLSEDVKKSRLNWNCDYTICHRGLRKLPHLVAIEAKVTKTLLQCIGKCASIIIAERKLEWGIFKSMTFIQLARSGSLFSLMKMDHCLFQKNINWILIMSKKDLT